MSSQPKEDPPSANGSLLSALGRMGGMVRPLVVGVMVGCIALSVARLARLMAEWAGAPST